MRVADLIITQGIRGVQAVKTSYSKRPDGGRVAHVRLTRSGFRCPGCGQADVAVYGERDREIAGLPVGRTRLVLHVTAHRIYCPDCGEAHYERIPFLPSPTARVTRQMERTILELRREMSVSAVAEYFGLSWHSVKNIGKNALGRKYAKVRLRNVRRLDIDRPTSSAMRRPTKSMSPSCATETEFILTATHSFSKRLQSSLLQCKSVVYTNAFDFERVFGYIHEN